MTVTFVRIDPKRGAPRLPSLPYPDAEPFRWCMRMPHRDDQYAFTSTEAELVAALIGQARYPNLDPQSALVERIKYAIHVQCWQQAGLNVIAQTVLTADWAGAETWQQDVLTGTRITQPGGWPTKSPSGVDEWTCPVPLVLVATAYEPYSEVPAPIGETIWWLDPIEDATLLGSLEDFPFGLIDVCAVEEL